MTSVADEIKGLYFPVLDHGFVALVDYMGDDDAIVQAARVSYGAGTKTINEDRGVLRYLMRHTHTTPFEMVELKFHVKLPIFVARQLIRHRTACLAGNVRLHFDLPGGIERRGNQLYKLTVKDVFDRFQPTVGSQGDPNFKRQRVQEMHLRCLNEETHTIEHTNIVDIWESGVKPVYRVQVAAATYDYGDGITMSADHLCLTETGWVRLKDVAKLPTKDDPSWSCDKRFISIGPGRDVGVVPQFNPIDEATENWLPIVGWEDFYEVSDQGRVRRIVGGKGSRSFGRCKKLTVFGSRAVVSLNRPGKQTVEQVHQLVLEAFIGPCPEGQECLHKDGNGLNNLLSNLHWGTPMQNAEDRIRDGATTRLKAHTSKIILIEYAGEEMTYDLEVAGPWHNFSAGGVVVHNSVNEYSLRYSLPAMQFYMPKLEDMGSQSKKNKQGRGVPIDRDAAIRIQKRWEILRQEQQTLYELMVQPHIDLARELARLDLPLSLYTEWYWKIDLHNCLHFLKLRCDKHAQWEIQQVARMKAAMCRLVAPTAFEAWIDYSFQARKFSRMEVKLLRYLIGANLVDPVKSGGEVEIKAGNWGWANAEALGMSKREWEDFMTTFDRVTTPDLFEPESFELDTSLAKPASFFKAEAEKYVPKTQ